MNQEKYGVRFTTEESKLFRVLIWLLTLIAVFYLAGQLWGVVGRFSDIILLVFLAWLLSFVLDPWVKHLSHFNISRTLSAVIIYLIVAGILVLIGFIFIPLLTSQTKAFLVSIQAANGQTPFWVEKAQMVFNSYGIPIDLQSLLSQQLNGLQHFSSSTLIQTVSLATQILSSLFNSFLVLLFSFYFIIDGERIWETLLSHAPAKYHTELTYIKETISFSFAGFLRTQLLLGLLMGIGTFIILFIFGINYAVAAAAFAGLAMTIPVIGPFLSIIPPLGVALLTEPATAIVLFLFIFILQAILINIIGPILFKKSVGLHPVLVLISFLVGFKLAGPWGAVFSVPVAGILIIIGSQVIRRWVQPPQTVITPELSQ